MNKLRVVPDTSVIIEGFLSKKIEKQELEIEEILIHEAVMAELESQANKNKETGYLGLEEVKKLRELGEKIGFKIEFKGNRPNDFEIKHAKSGEIDSLIRHLAFEEDATLVTADKVQSLVAESKGIKIILYESIQEEKEFVLDKYFDKTTMSIHLKENCKVMAKKGKPGDWEYTQVTDDILNRDEIKELAKAITEETCSRPDGFVESDRKGSTIIQLANNRIVITRPPFADGYEITCVRPVKKLKLSEYQLNQKVLNRIDEKTEGILIAGAPGNGKSTFAQALAEHYLSKKRIVKTIENPRDLNLGDEITQYNLNHGSSQEIHDILLLSRPDYTIFDEMRNTEDFRLFSDLRLSGVGMVGVVHATNPIDAIQRFIGRIELGVIPHVIDTVIFIKNGMIEKTFSVAMEVKVPNGMTESDLARPVVTVNDFLSGKLEFEIYSYGEETNVIPVKADFRNPMQKLAEETIIRELKNYVDKSEVKLISPGYCKVSVKKGEKSLLIGKDGTIIDKLQEKLGLHIDIIEEEEKKSEKRNERTRSLNYQVTFDKKNICFELGIDNSDLEVDIYIESEFLMTVKSSKKGVITINKNNRIGSMIEKSISSNELIEILSKHAE